ncbi:MAG: carboxypeptidase regulatory-like domain-containing protein [Porphyrobacter sp.]|nr:carboxypeptidase regulatory-like domain-containing protein [Porphyrobacter sp.]
MPAPETLAAVLIATGALAGAMRLLLMRRDARAAALALLTLACGGLLYLTLFPPLLPVGGETLLVATAETPASTKAGRGERLIALPEAPRLAEADRVPDLATALRRHTRVAAIRILGRGLTARDRDMAAGIPASFTPLPTPLGLIRLDPSADTPAGAVFALGGEAARLEGGAAELLDPSGARVDRRVIGPEGVFTLGAAARAPGLALFTLRLRGRDGAIVSDTPVPLRTLAEPEPLRVLLIGAPSPEAKYLRRWAEDSGIALQSRLEAGGGVDLGDAEVRLDAASLRELDAVIIDDRTLAALGSRSRSALAQAVAGGLGVVLRMTGPATVGSRESWRALGLTVEGGSDVAEVAHAPLAEDAEALAIRRGPAAGDIPPDTNLLEDPAPDLGRWAVKAGADFVPTVLDADGAMLAGWQQRGQGRAGLWTLANSFALVLGGQSDRYYQWWSEMVSAVARPARVFRPEVRSLLIAGERAALCGLAGSPQVRAPAGNEVPLAIDPEAGPRGCAAYWPLHDGVHVIIQPGKDGEETYPIAVLPADALLASQARETGEATTRWVASQNIAVTTRDVPDRQGPAWPWLLGWLTVSAALWFGERRWRIEPA